ncbi:MAG TPA: serine hydrolase, partial [Erythrobacter sp.]|nr:serine hydrolase [Erythrobacter sp.]HBM04950.1 serine hydrolase [Erythrobacter sp.]HCO45670.1 serine hydrolase [Erythrobacter sp.]
MFDLADAGELGFDADRLARIAPFLSDAYIANGRLPNAQLVVARDGRPVHYTSLGKMGDDGRELRDDALFRIASMTKPVASVAFMQLVEQCKVAL